MHESWLQATRAKMERSLLEDASASASDGESDPTVRSQPRRGGTRSLLRIIALVSVPLLWGSYTPALKLLLTRRNAPPAILTNLVSHFVGFVSLLVILLVQRCSGACADDAAAPHRASWERTLRASLELGVYLFFGQLTQLVGLGGTSATINAILVQSSVVVVPLLDGGSSSSSSRRPLRVAAQLLPSFLAFGGVALITGVASAADGEAADDADSANTSLGIGLSLASAAFYALHTLRLSHYGDVDATVQAVGQVAVNTLLDVLALPVAAAIPGAGAGAWLAGARRAARRRLLVAAAWNGVFVVGATTWAMSYAQQACSASTAALAYAMEPLFAAVIAAAMLGERLAPSQFAGGALVVGANCVAALGARALWRLCARRRC